MSSGLNPWKNKAALEAGCHVLCEKPTAMNAGEGRAMRDAARKNGMRLMRFHFSNESGIYDMELTERPGSDSNPREHLVDCILEDRPHMATEEEGFAIMAILDAIYESARRGKAVEVKGE